VILYEDGYIKLDYDPSTDVLYAPSPDIHKDELLYLYKAFSIIVDTLINYDIKYLLLDASYSQTTVSEEEYTIVMEQLVRDLGATRLQKLARVVSSSQMRELKATRYLHEAPDLFPYVLQNFTSKEAAEKWLKQK
jgi:hypothetical protein